GGLEQIFCTAHLDHALALLYGGADAGGSEHSTEPKAPGADALDEGALRHQINAHAPRKHLLLGARIEPYMAGDGAGNEARIDELADASSWRAGVVGDDD